MAAVHASTMGRDSNECVFTDQKDTATPRDYISLLASYKAVYKLKCGALQKQCERMEGG